jgi:hypothetical protein
MLRGRGGEGREVLLLQIRISSRKAMGDLHHTATLTAGAEKWNKAIFKQKPERGMF